jgi:hypothetical protein
LSKLSDEILKVLRKLNIFISKNFYINNKKWEIIPISQLKIGLRDLQFKVSNSEPHICNMQGHMRIFLKVNLPDRVIEEPNFHKLPWRLMLLMREEII